MDNNVKIVIIQNYHHNHIGVADKIKPHKRRHQIRMRG